MHAVRNLRLCTKDCLCLYVCPTGASDTENGQIDATKCLDGCRKCVDACPSHAISLVPDNYPPQQVKTEEVKKELQKLLNSKAEQQRLAEGIASSAGNPVLRQFAKAIAFSNLRMAEDMARECGYMVPQSDETRALLEQSLKNAGPDFPKEAAKKLLERLK